MELCMKIAETIVCAKWAGLSELVDSIQLVVWIATIYQLYLLKQAHSQRK